MFSSIDEFIKYIPNFETLSSGDLIPFFVYFCNQKSDCEVTPKDVKACFDELMLLPYSNISAYLSRKSERKGAIYLKRKNGYILSRTGKEAIQKTLLVEIELHPTNSLIDLSLLDGTPYYIRKIAEQMSCCYDNGLYDACLVMMRKLFETLIIECYERYSSVLEIKDNNGNFYYLSDLIPLYLASTHWSVSRNFEKHIKNVKKYGDLSAHNRRFFAKKSEIDSFKFDLRQSMQEIILTIDYLHWSKEQHNVSPT